LEGMLFKKIKFFVYSFVSYKYNLRIIRGYNMIIRFAEENDFEAVLGLLKKVKLPFKGVKENISRFLILDSGGTVIGVVGLEKYANKGLIRSLCVVPGKQGEGIGGKLFDAVIKYAKEENCDEVYLLTETAEKFFAARGFEVIDRDDAAREVRESFEFQSVCPLSAVCMKMKL